MKIKNTLNLCNELVSKTTNKSEIKVYREFIEILSNLEKRDLTEAEVNSLEKELATLDLDNDSINKKKHLRKTLQQFKKFLNDTFSLITKGYYTKPGVTFGAFIGLLFGVLFLSNFERSLGISYGLSGGIFIGIIVASLLESQAKVSGRLI